MTAPLVRQTEHIGSVFQGAFDAGFAEVGVLTAAVVLCCLGPQATARGLRFVFRKERGAAPLTAPELESVGRTLLLAERTWLSLGLLALAVPLLGSVAYLASVLRGEADMAAPGFPPSYGLLILANAVVARLVIGSSGRAALARALERGEGVEPSAAVTSRVSDALLLAHLIVPPLWFPLLFYRFPGG